MSFFKNMGIGERARVEAQLVEWSKQTYCSGPRIEPGSWTINKDLTVDVKGSVWLIKLNFEKFPVKFNKVSGSFSCYNCSSLKTLEGAPKEVGGDFYAQACGKNFTRDEVNSVCKVGNQIFV